MAVALPTFMVIKKLLLLCPTQSFDVMHRKMICNQKCMLSNLPNFPYYMSVVVQSLGFTFSSLASHPSSSQLYLSWNKSCFFSVPCLYSCDFVIAVFLLCMNYTTTVLLLEPTFQEKYSQVAWSGKHSEYTVIRFIFFGLKLSNVGCQRAGVAQKRANFEQNKILKDETSHGIFRMFPRPCDLRVSLLKCKL